jgi:hypothetical protein
MNRTGEGHCYEVLIIPVVAICAVLFWCVLGALFLALASLGVLAASQIGQGLGEMEKGVDAGAGALEGNDRPSDCHIEPEMQLLLPEWREPNF